MLLRDEALKTMAEIADLYFVKRDMQAVSRRIDHDILWIGIGRGEVGRGYEQVVGLLARANDARTDRFSIRDSRYDAVRVAPELYCVWGELTLCQENTAPPKQSVRLIRLTALLRERNGEFRLNQLHLSQTDAAYGEEGAASRYTDGQQAGREEMDRNLRTLTNNLPGGVQKCLNDEYFTIQDVSDGFLSMFGYTREEIAALFQNRYIEMIHPEDRSAVLKQIKEQLRLGNRIEAEYRVCCADGGCKYVLDNGELISEKDGRETFYCILIDITARKKLDEDYRILAERYQLILNQTNDIIFEWDLAEDSVLFSEDPGRRFDLPKRITNVGTFFTEKTRIHEDDAAVIPALIDGVKRGEEYQEAKCRLWAYNRYLWLKIRMTTLFNDSRIPVKAVGVLSDISVEVERSRKLTERAEHDVLTGTYNRTTVSELIKECLEQAPDAVHALMMIDIDDFKLINDTKGHLFGDTVLKDIGRLLRSKTRSTDIVGRMGGDEFIIFLKDVGSGGQAEKRADEIIRALERLLPGETMCTLSCSVGIACSPECGTTFFELYDKADKALYIAKNKGKNQFATYSVRPDVQPEQERQAFGQTGMELRKQDDSDGEVLKNVIEILYTALDFQWAVQSVLSFLGEHYEVSRVYILARLADGGCWKNLFEWSSGKIEARFLSYSDEEMESYRRHFDMDGVFYCKSVDDLAQAERGLFKERGIRSMLQCVLRDGMEIVGLIGFEECRKNRYWTKEQVDTLTVIAKILATFFIKERYKRLAVQK